MCHEAAWWASESASAWDMWTWAVKGYNLGLLTSDGDVEFLLLVVVVKRMVVVAALIAAGCLLLLLLLVMVVVVVLLVVALAEAEAEAVAVIATYFRRAHGESSVWKLQVKR